MLVRRYTRVIVSLLVLAACTGREAQGRQGVEERLPVAVRDDAGRAVRLARPAERIVSLAPPFTELLFALGAGNRVVGRTRWDEDPHAARAVPAVGDGLDPNVEAIVAQRPDLVVFYQSASNAAAIARLDELCVASISIRLDRIADYRRAVRLLARLTGTTPAADSLLAEFDRDLAAAAAPARERPRRPLSVLVLAWDNPPIVIGAGSFLSELVALAGARNAFADVAQPSAQVSIETIAARDPDVVLVTGGAGAPSLAGRPEWRSVAAIRNRRFVRVEGTEFAWPSSRTPAAVRQLRAALAVARP